ncbi:hypothetical protein HNQ07_003503 [Deinococcus metalli]|uniref:Uncharacterized protein n=1 Tax=Deinococcus metalli TaxID=1141878 RepID=A0A7W8KH43_9DEIO|nr:hypothetical protein [Deinococcus metalli]MBB5378002.1 hypothetical protein [Deinococcus metalli]GHF53704.1 hypothetical protein GCM10017781_32410 [Deinococcus metalli]
MPHSEVKWNRDQIRLLLERPGHRENLEAICALGLTLTARAVLRRGSVRYVLQATAPNGDTVQSRPSFRLEDGLFDVWPRALHLAGRL